LGRAKGLRPDWWAANRKSTEQDEADMEENTRAMTLLSCTFVLLFGPRRSPRQRELTCTSAYKNREKLDTTDHTRWAQERAGLKSLPRLPKERFSLAMTQSPPRV
jgi:hypothetical protein